MRASSSAKNCDERGAFLAVQAMNALTSQQYADLLLRYWQGDLRKLPKSERETKLDELIRNLKGGTHERQ